MRSQQSDDDCLCRTAPISNTKCCGLLCVALNMRRRIGVCFSRGQGGFKQESDFAVRLQFHAKSLVDRFHHPDAARPTCCDSTETGLSSSEPRLLGKLRDWPVKRLPSNSSFGSRVGDADRNLIAIFGSSFAQPDRLGRAANLPGPAPTPSPRPRLAYRPTESDHLHIQCGRLLNEASREQSAAAISCDLPWSPTRGSESPSTIRDCHARLSAAT